MAFALRRPLISLLLLAAVAPAAALRAEEPGKAATGPAGDEAGLAAIERLGKRIFEDRTLSRPAGVSCASCHDPNKAFQGNNGSPIAAVARGSRPDAFGTRKTPTIAYASFSPPFAFIDKKNEETGAMEKAPIGGQFHDGRAADLAQQFEGPLLNPVEMNSPSKRAAVETIRDGSYAALAREVYGAGLFDDPEAAFPKLAQAVAAYESSARFHPFASKFDDYLRGRAKLTPQEAKGFALFKDEKKGNCIACHVGKDGSRDPKDWLFTDYSYDALGAPRNAAIPANGDPANFDLGLCGRKELAQIAPKGVETDAFCGAFKVPTLRNVAVNGPYLHNGVFAKLRDVVAFYATRDTDPGRWYQKKADGGVAKYDDLPQKYHANVNEKEAPYDRKPGQKPRLSDAEIDAITAFLETLTDRPAK